MLPDRHRIHPHLANRLPAVGAEKGPVCSEADQPHHHHHEHVGRHAEREPGLTHASQIDHGEDRNREHA